MAHWNLLELRSRFIKQAVQELKRAEGLGPSDWVSHNESALAEHQQMALIQIQEMRQSTPPTAELELVAARVFALAIDAGRLNSKSPTCDSQNDLFEELFTACELAIEQNLHRDDLQELSAILPELQNAERFQRLLTSDPPSREVQALSRFADIFPEVRARMVSVQ